MAFQRPPSALVSALGSEQFPFEAGRYILYVSLACPWSNAVLQVARLKGLVGEFASSSSNCRTLHADAKLPLQVAFLHPTWQYTNPEADRESMGGLAAGVAASEPHAGWIFGPPGQRLLPLALMKNASEAGLELSGGSAEELCARNLQSRDAIPEAILQEFGVSSKYCTPDPSKHRCKTLRHLYEACGVNVSSRVRATTPTLYDANADLMVNNEPDDLLVFFNEWGAGQGPDLYPSALKSEVDKMVEWIYTINDGVYRCGFARSQPSYDASAVELEQRMREVDEFLATNKFLVGEQLTIADIRLFNTLIRMDEVYVAYFKCYFASIFASFEEGQGSKYPNLLRHTACLYNDYPEIRESVCMDEIRNHYFTSHAIRNSFAIVPKEVGVLRKLEEMKE